MRGGDGGKGGAGEQVKVLYKRPTDLALKADVPVVCNLLLADIMDEGAPRSTPAPAPLPREWRRPAPRNPRPVPVPAQPLTASG